MNSDNLKERIEEALQSVTSYNTKPIPHSRTWYRRQKTTNQLLQLFQDYAMGCVPPARATLPDDDAFNLGWNECRQDILDKLEDKQQ